MCDLQPFFLSQTKVELSEEKLEQPNLSGKLDKSSGKARQTVGHGCRFSKLLLAGMLRNSLVYVLVV